MQSTVLDLETKLHRSRGRGGRVISATARVTRSEQQEMEAAAKLRGQSLSEWCREMLLAAARNETITPIFTELVGMRLLLNATMRYAACGERMTPEQFQDELYDVRATKHKAAADVMQQYARTEERK